MPQWNIMNIVKKCINKWKIIMNQIKKILLLIGLTVLLSATTFAAAAKTVQILTTTDTHGRFMPYNYETNKPDYSGSLAQIATEVKKLRQENPQGTVLVDNGDIIQENSQVLFVKSGEINPMIAAMNYMGYDLINLGNHEFNYGIPALKKVMAKFKAVDNKPNSVLCGNLFYKSGGYVFAPYKIVTTKNGIKIGFIGMVTPNITRWDAPNLKGYQVADPVLETKKIIAQIKDKVDLLVAIEHMGEENEFNLKDTGVTDLAAKCPELDLIICGHAHENIAGNYYYNGKLYRQDNIPEDAKAKGTLILEAGCRGNNLGQILVKLTDVNGKYEITDKAKDIESKLIPMQYEVDGKTEHIKPDPQLVKLLEPYNKIAIKDGNKVIGELVGDKPLAPINIIKGISQRELQPNAMIELINNVQLYYANKMLKGIGKVKVSAASLLSLDGNVFPGKIRKSDMSLIYKYPNTLYVMKMNGAQLRKFMEFCAGFFNQYHKGDLTISFNPNFRSYLFCNFSGVNYDINISKPVGQRIENLTWSDGSGVKDNELFLIAVNNYLANSHLATAGSVFTKDDTFPQIIFRGDKEPGIKNIQQLIADYIQNVKKGKITADYTENWKIIGNDWNQEQHNKAVELINNGTISVQDHYDREPNSKPVTWTEVEKAIKN